MTFVVVCTSMKKVYHRAACALCALVGASVLAGFAIPAIAQTSILQPVYDPRPFGSTLEVHINDNGSVSVQGARVEQVAGSTLYAKVYWGVSFLRLTVRTDAKTHFEKRFGQEILVSDISIGDYIGVTGVLFEGSNSLDVVAKTVKDWSLQTAEESVSGTITGLNAATATSSLSFPFSSKTRGSILLTLAPGAVVTKGNLTLDVNALGTGVKVTSAGGVFNHLKKTFEAKNVKIYQNMSLFQARNFEGKIKSLSGTVVPATLVVTSGGVDYTVPIVGGIEFLNKKREAMPLARFIEGDVVRMYGTIREASPNIVDITLLRNMSL